ncbi:3-hydroxybutyrate dehydrogenase [Dongia deserti]|uniref:3-hydroxybutyrate dehydrogenase n=1 Tax=Dongia deserti TaxID=2268030 RepID=UPI000E646415|nr:3-hydroxybutyrate dehydrogenase [Dongia deserti]
MLGSETMAPAALHMQRPLAGQVAIVTGSTSGIGLGILEQMAAAGATVVMNGLGDISQIEDALTRIRTAHDIEAIYVPADLMEPKACVEMITATEQRFGKIDILVNNAGIQHVSPIESFPPEKWDAILALNLSSAFHAICASFAGMKARGHGRIINVASAHGLVASPFKSAYVAAKHGIIGLTKTVALEGAEFGVTANAICPGYVWTPLVEKQIDDQAKSHGISRDEVIKNILLAQQPNKRFAETSEIGALAVFLASDAAQSITGTALPVDGGWTAH